MIFIIVFIVLVAFAGVILLPVFFSEKKMKTQLKDLCEMKEERKPTKTVFSLYLSDNPMHAPRVIEYEDRLTYMGCDELILLSGDSHWFTRQLKDDSVNFVQLPTDNGIVYLNKRVIHYFTLEVREIQAETGE